MGELLIDFTENGISNQGNPLLEANPGGAPCNVLSMLTNLGHSTAFIGKVGDDIFGEMLKERVSGLNINIENLVSVLEAGANVIVAGSAVFKNDAGANVKRFKEIMSTY